jgi:hypothetical protein
VINEQKLQDTQFKTLIESLVSVQPFSKQRRKPIERFLRELMCWVAYQDELFRNQASVSLHDYMYPYYRANRRRGYYPFPHSKLRKWNKRYNTIIKWLLDIGFLEESPFKYCPDRSICKYYRVNKCWKINATAPSTDLDKKSSYNVKSVMSEAALMV